MKKRAIGKNGRKRKNAKLIAIVGPSASGKTYLAGKLAKKLGKKSTAVISQDQYYKDWSKLPLKKREQINFDHPDAFDFSLLHEQLKNLKRSKSIKVPNYSYTQHKRVKKKTKVKPKEWVIVEGLLLLHRKGIKDLFDMKVYVDVDNATSLARRIRRDTRERGESVSSVSTRFFNDVVPMQEEYVVPQKNYVNFVISGKGDGQEKMKEIARWLKRK